MCVCVYIYVYICMYINMCVCMCVCICACVYSIQLSTPLKFNYTVYLVYKYMLTQSSSIHLIIDLNRK